MELAIVVLVLLCCGLIVRNSCIEGDFERRIDGFVAGRDEQQRQLAEETKAKNHWRQIAEALRSETSDYEEQLKAIQDILNGDYEYTENEEEETSNNEDE